MHTTGVSSFLKVMLALLLTLPLGAYITGTLVASQADMPAQRETVVIEQSPADEATTPSTPTPRKTPRPKPPRERDDSDDRDSDDRDRDDVRVVRPTPRDVDEDWDDDVDDDSDDDSDDGDDDS